MRIQVVGAGIIGVCTAYYLRQDGHEVTVFDRRGDVAQETSFGNAGVIAPGYVTPWAAPGMPRKVLSYLFKAEAPVLFRPTPSPALWRWIRRWLDECTLERYRVNKSRMQRIAFYSRAQLHALREALDIRYEQSQGYLQLFRKPIDVELAAPARALLEEQGIPFQTLDAAQCRALEPALSPATALAGGLHLPGDEAGNCPLFAQQLRRICERQGVRFRFHRPVRRIAVEGGRACGVVTDDGLQAADAVVVAAATDSAALLTPLGLKLPLYPVKGYSATVALLPDGQGPGRALMDEAYKTAITPFGARLRIAGTAELGDTSLRLRQAALRTLIKVASDWLPGAAQYSQASYWVGARPMLPDGPPLLGPSGVDRLFLNVGHGSTGWAMSCGSGKVVADVVAGREPGISLDGLTIDRYAGPARTA
ncbi:MAG: D-amino acid dehydrogenase [Burkholderiaceae bacterium]